MIKFYLLLLTFFSCSYFTGMIGKNDNNIELIDPTTNQDLHTCKESSTQSFQILGGSKESQETFYQLIQSIEKNGVLISFKEKAIIWTLLQININPVLSSPHARFQMAYQKNDFVSFLDMSTTTKAQDGFPMFYGLDEWLKMMKADPQLISKWILYLQNNFHERFYVSDELALFFKQYKDQIKLDPHLRNYYFHGDDVLSKGEKLPRIPWEKIYKIYQTKRSPLDYQVIKHLLPYPKSQHDSISCNYDFDLYDRSVFGIDKNTLKGQSFGLIQGNEGFMAMTIQTTQIKSVSESPLFEGSSTIRGGTFCLFQSKESSENLWVLSQDSRDPGQHIYQLIQKGLRANNSTEQIHTSLARMRYLFLLHPLRLIVETNRAQKSELDRLLKLDVPIYHSNQLGLIWTMKNKVNHKAQFVLDPRYPGFLNCKK